MKNNQIKLVALTLVIVGLGLAYPLFVGGSGDRPPDEPSEIAYVDTKTGAVFMLPSRISPEQNPETGMMTLVPGMYCTECKAWKAVGSLENRQSKRFSRTCPIHKIPLTRDAPESE